MGYNAVLAALPWVLSEVTQTGGFLDEMSDTTVRFRTNGYVDGEKMLFPGHFGMGLVKVM